ncbi:nitroreductase family protein [Paraclostridium sordellii]|uniref:Nitroreductase-family protein n=1 Tax=Paraclostridium sordellii TaxID=1505 RepID=A0A0C7G6C2_PARSO|nr:nitroreductase family protein [Paeniclostridium sordellii]CEN78129.1 Nitroreductase-family protein [[Clostridium] sordellii] [Paeniclostridium sordellii]CEQ03215.1 Nitroreductase-family protein [[Clostridium] sordellii] [Paeniclostridium sordellii]
MNYKYLISNKRSVRKFKNQEIKKSDFRIIEEYINMSKKLVPEISTEIKVFNKDKVYPKLDKIAGYNGHMIEAPNYVIILSDIGKGYIENSGYIGENLTLKAMDLGIDSCWVTFKESSLIKEKLEILSDKEVTAIIALGYGDTIKTKSATSDSSRLGVEKIVYLDKWGENATIELLEERGLLDAFSFARMAPSTLNRQPWRFIIDGGKVILAVRKDEFASEYEGKVDVGIVMLYFSLIIDTTMFNLKWTLENGNGNYYVPTDYEIIGYCNI